MGTERHDAMAAPLDVSSAGIAGNLKRLVVVIVAKDRGRVQLGCADALIYV